MGEDLTALLLDNKGHIRDGIIVRRDEPAAFTLVLDGGDGQATATLLHDYHFSEDLEITGPERSDAALVIGGGSVPPGAELTVAGWIPGTAIALLPQPLAEDDPAEAHELAEILRIEAGIPRFGVDTTERTLPHETGLVSRTVSFDKGCYLGQETVARVQYRGGVKRHLRGVRTAVPLEPGALLQADGADVATITSAAVSPRHGAIGLAVVRDDRVGSALTAGGEPVVVDELPFGAGD